MSNRSEEAQALDLLSEQLSLLRFHGDLDLVVNLTASWGLSFEATPGTAFFYVVVEGSCFLEILGGPGESPHLLDLNIGDLVFLPQGDCHHLKAETGSPVRPACQNLSSKFVSERGTMVTLGAEGAKAKLIRGYFRFDSAFAPSFLKPLGQVVLVRALDSDRHRSIQSVMELLRSEQSSQEPGTDTATEALLKLLFIQLIRLAMTQPIKNGHPCEKRPIALMFAPSMQSVAHALHSEPEQPWSVAKLATLAGLSRTSFAVQFQSLTGIPPMAYLTRIRMMKAIDCLERTNATLEVIASQVGYGSEAAFSIAFKREMGSSPGTYRKNRKRQSDHALSASLG